MTPPQWPGHEAARREGATLCVDLRNKVHLALLDEWRLKHNGTEPPKQLPPGSSKPRGFEELYRYTAPQTKGEPP